VSRLLQRDDRANRATAGDPHRPAIDRPAWGQHRRRLHRAARRQPRGAALRDQQPAALDHRQGDRI